MKMEKKAQRLFCSLLFLRKYMRAETFELFYHFVDVNFVDYLVLD